MRRLHARERGFSTIEIMIAGGLVAFLAVALLPAVFSLVEGSKISAFRAICTATARAKLNEYLNGQPLRDNNGNEYVPSGFEYTKARYQQLGGPTGDSICDVSGANPNSPGRRERVSTNAIVSDTDGQEYTSATSRGGISAVFQGFQLYVNIRHVNPRLVNSLIKQSKRACPLQTYQFFRSGDALEVEVTGMIRTAPSVLQGGRGGKHYGNLTDETGNIVNRQLTCSVSQIVKPQAFPFRYFLGNDGKIRNYQVTLAYRDGAPNSSREGTVAHFRNLWARGGAAQTAFDTAGLGNIRSFVVAPDNLSVYVLRPSLLTLYRSCSDRSVTVSGAVFPGSPDCSLEIADRTEWQDIDPNIESIAVDFGEGSRDLDEAIPYPNDDRIYGLYNSGGNETVFNVASSLRIGQIREFQRATWSGAGSWQNAPAYSVPPKRPRIQGIFMAPVIPPAPNLLASLFFFDNSCYSTNTTFGDSAINSLTTTYCATIFNSGDESQTAEVREMPIQAEALSL